MNIDLEELDSIEIKRVTEYGGPWTGHLLFGYYLVKKFKPKTIVELGTYRGESYFSFCQAVHENNIPAKCYAVDTWEGDKHSGFYDNDIYEEVKVLNKPYKSFSKLIRSTFDNALNKFRDDSIDMLHIDGLHTYEAVKHDYYNWLPKVKQGGIILFHDTTVKEKDFGVYKLWDELKDKYVSLEFKHSNGLGVILNQKKTKLICKKIDFLFSIDQKEIKGIFNNFSNKILIQCKNNYINNLLDILAQKDQQIVQKDQQIAQKDQQIAKKDQQILQYLIVLEEHNKELINYNNLINTYVKNYN